MFHDSMWFLTLYPNHNTKHERDSSWNHSTARDASDMSGGVLETLDNFIGLTARFHD